MKREQKNRKTWSKPSVRVLVIKKDTFSGSQYGVESAGKSGQPPTKW